MALNYSQCPWSVRLWRASTSLLSFGDASDRPRDLHGVKSKASKWRFRWIASAKKQSIFQDIFACIRRNILYFHQDEMCPDTVGAWVRTTDGLISQCCEAVWLSQGRTTFRVLICTVAQVSTLKDRLAVWSWFSSSIVRMPRRGDTSGARRNRHGASMERPFFIRPMLVPIQVSSRHNGMICRNSNVILIACHLASAAPPGG